MSLFVKLDVDDHTDFKQVADNALENAPQEMQAFIRGQLDNVSESANGRLGDPKFIIFCLGIYIKSPAV